MSGSLEHATEGPCLPRSRDSGNSSVGATICGGTWWLLFVFVPDSVPSQAKRARPTAFRRIALCLAPVSESALRRR